MPVISALRNRRQEDYSNFETSWTIRKTLQFKKQNKQKNVQKDWRNGTLRETITEIWVYGRADVRNVLYLGLRDVGGGPFFPKSRTLERGPACVSWGVVIYCGGAPPWVCQGKLCREGGKEDLRASVLWTASALRELSIGMVEAVYTSGLLSWHVSHELHTQRVSPLSFIYRVNECQLADKKYSKREGLFLQNR